MSFSVFKLSGYLINSLHLGLCLNFLKKFSIFDFLCFFCNCSFAFIILFIGCVQSYGKNCRNACSMHCVNETCNIFNGSCVYGCEEGFSGDRCDKGI